MDDYCTRSDLYSHGLPRGILGESARPIVAVDIANNRLELGEHGFAADQALVLVTELNGALPSPLVAGVTYYAKLVADSESLFQLAATVGGAAIDLTSVGTKPFGIAPSVNAAIEAAIRYESRIVDTYAIEHKLPLSPPYPEEVVAITAKLAAREAMSRLGRQSDLIDQAAERAIVELRRFARGTSLRDAAAPEEPNVAAWGESSRMHELEGGRVL